MKITEIKPDEEKAAASAEKKPLIEIIESTEKKDANKTKTNTDDSKVIIEDVTNVDTQAIEAGKDKSKEITEKAKEEKDAEVVNNTGIVVEGNKVIDHDKKTVTEKKAEKTKKIPIREIPLNSTAVSKGSPKKTEGNNESDKKGDDKSKNSKGDSTATSSQGAGERRPSGELFITVRNYSNLALNVSTCLDKKILA